MLPSSTVITPNVLTDPLIDIERACSTFEGNNAPMKKSQIADMMTSYSKLSERVSQAFEQWTIQHETYKALLDSEPVVHSDKQYNNQTIAELLTTLNDLANKLDCEITAISNNTGSIDTAIQLWKQHECTYVSLQEKLVTSSKESTNLSR